MELVRWVLDVKCLRKHEFLGGIAEYYSPEEPLFTIEPQKLRKKLRKWLIAVGVDEGEAPFYSTHSCRAGGATTAAKMGIQDSVIQRHGRWRSTCFMKYTRMERTEAGEILTIKL